MGATNIIIDSEIIKAINILQAAGIKVGRERFPFTYHHDFVRSRSGQPLLGRGLVASTMHSYREKHGDSKYIKHLIYGALLYMLANEPIQMALAIRNYEFARFFAGLANEF